MGGLGETGALNCMLYETEQTAIVVDCGVRFMDESFPGVSLAIPNFDFLEPVKDKLKAVVFTHGHEDHVGALPYLMRRFPLPVYATDFTRGIIHTKFKELHLTDLQLNPLAFDKPVTIGDITIDPVFVNHSMMDVAALLISTSQVKAFHCTDFKIDHAAPERVIDLARIGEIGSQGLDLLLLDSTNALAPGWTESETKVRANLLELFTKIRGRIVACLFSSNAFRVQSLIECARITGRKVALTGRSTREYVRIASELKRLDSSGVALYDVEEIVNFPDAQILVLVTGSQAEPRSVLNRMSHNMFRPFRIRPGDTLLMTSKMIPGNEGRILAMLNRLSALGAEIIHDRMEPSIHASGHAKQDELREMIRLTRPRCFIPIHGEYRHLKKNRDIAVLEGVAEENALVILDGQTVVLSPEGLAPLDQQEIGQTLVSENTDYFITNRAVTRRRKMAFNGLVVVSVLYDKKHSRVRLPVQLASEGIFGEPEEAKALTGLSSFLGELIDEDPRIELGRLEKFFKIETRRFYKMEYQLRPEVVVVVHEI